MSERITHLITEVVDGEASTYDEVSYEAMQATAESVGQVVREQLRLSPAGDVLAILRASGMTETQIDSVVVNLAANVVSGLL